MPRAALVLAAVVGLACPAFCATVTVNDGDQFVAALSAAQPGDVIILAPGVYPGPYDLGSEDLAQTAPAAPHGTEDAPIVVRAASPADASLSDPATLGLGSLPANPEGLQLVPGPVDFDFSDNGTRISHADQFDVWGRLKLVGAQHIVFEDLDLRSSGNCNVILSNCTGITLRRCRIRDASDTGLLIRGFCQGILIEDCLVCANGLRGGDVDGIMTQHGRNITVRNTRFVFNSSAGMNVGGAKGVLFENNLVALNGLSWYSDTTGPGLRIRRDLTHLDWLPKDVATDGYTPSVIRNCLFYNNGAANLAVSGASGADTSIDVLGNTFITRGLRHSLGSISLSYDNGGSSPQSNPDDNPRNVDFVDNVFYVDNSSLGSDARGCSVYFFTDATAQQCPFWQRYSGNTYITSHPAVFLRQHTASGRYLDLHTAAVELNMQPRSLVALPAGAEQTETAPASGPAAHQP